MCGIVGYYVSVAKGLDVDKPRNLAKSVTVEQKKSLVRGLILNIVILFILN